MLTLLAVRREHVIISINENTAQVPRVREVSFIFNAKIALCAKSCAAAESRGEWINLSNNSECLYRVNKITVVSC